MAYWDTSALLKLYVREPDSPKFVSIVGLDPLVTSELAKVEIFSALRRKEQNGDLIPDGAVALFARFSDDVTKGRVSIVPMGSDITTKSVELIVTAHQMSPRIMARSLDILHVASAIVAGCNTLVGTDVRQRELAQMAGLRLIPA